MSTKFDSVPVHVRDSAGEVGVLMVIESDGEFGYVTYDGRSLVRTEIETLTAEVSQQPTLPSKHLMETP